jgi:hypothetical protein
MDEEWQIGDFAEVLCSDSNWRLAEYRLDIDGMLTYWLFADGAGRYAHVSKARRVTPPLPDLSDRAAVEEWLDGE